MGNPNPMILTTDLRVTTSLQKEPEVVVVGRGDVDEFDRTAELTVDTRGNHWTQVLMMKTDHRATVLHHLVEIVL